MTDRGYQERSTRKWVVVTSLSLTRFICIAVILFPLVISASADDVLFPPTDYIHSKLQQNDIVFLGTTHKKPEILGFTAELIPTLEKYEVSHVGLEIPSDQQEKIDTPGYPIRNKHVVHLGIIHNS